jgi:dihydrolipoamide dehydrogenase
MTCKVLVVGAGPGGYVAAIRAGQLGLDTILVEGDRLGGTCLIRGCIPSKALIHVAERFAEVCDCVKGNAFGITLPGAPAFDMGKAIAWKDGLVDTLNRGVAGLLKRAKVRTVVGWARFENAKICTVETEEGSRRIAAEHVILATGSTTVPLASLPFGGNVISSTEALSLRQVPPRLVVVGAGYIGLELGSAFRKLGAEVAVLEAQPRILPTVDEELAKPVARWLHDNGVAVHLDSTVTGLSEAGEVVAEDARGNPLVLPADKILVTVGRRANTRGWGLENMAVDMEGPFIKVDATCATSMRDVWAIGDVTGEPMLAHRATAQGETVAEIIAGHKRAFDPAAIPAVCFTEPEIVAVGLTPEEAVARGFAVSVGRFPFAANGRALTLEAGTGGGFVRVTARKDNGVVLGVHAVGKHVSELTGEFVLALEMGARVEDLATTIHPHPTLGETLPEAALATFGQAIHA